MTTGTININGYIEGYYGRLLKWSERHLVLKKLSQSKFNTYFYCPKEDLKHRLNWRKKYTKKWTTSFKHFCKISKKLDINILTGISPGLDYQFEKNSQDFNFLLTKAKELKSAGSNQIVLMFDDIPANLLKNNTKGKSEGTIHAELTNLLSEKLNDIIYVVPRVYSDELIKKNCTYLIDFTNTINKMTPIFYCGKNIVSNSNNESEFETIKKTSVNNIIFWDNLYANDYCPKKIFLGPWFGRNKLHNVMVNLTGMLETDLFLLDLIGLTATLNNNELSWETIIKKYKIPSEFNIISKYFFPINYLFDIQNINQSYSDQIKALDHLLWKWKTPLSREWYQYLLMLKQDLQFFYNDLDNNRIKKIFPIPLHNAIIIKKG